MYRIKDILEEIMRLRLKRNWTEYELSVRSNIPQSTISTWYRKKQTPTVESLEKVCKGFGITLSQFFAEEDDVPIYLTKEQKEMLDDWLALSKEQQNLLSKLFKTMP